MKPAPWTQTGWIDDVTAWIDGNVGRTGPLEVVKEAPISAVIKVPTQEGDAYFKEPRDLPLFAHEPVVTQGLAEIFPTRIPAVLAIEENRRWMLSADCGMPLDNRIDEAVRRRVLQLYTHLQVEVAGRADELLEIGCLDRRLDRLERQLESHFDGPLIDSLLTEEQIDQLAQEVPRFRRFQKNKHSASSRRGFHVDKPLG
ncbi:MAG: hypothetical protein GKR89_03970 [Candidatus Latescibacteria bacterium]|nr:hypothetical protein [Candidatus Latescibacterota bacterium]